jgi:hypothetical protein
MNKEIKQVKIKQRRIRRYSEGKRRKVGEENKEMKREKKDEKAKENKGI